jgi:hypothetical protein
MLLHSLFGNIFVLITLIQDGLMVLEKNSSSKYIFVDEKAADTDSTLKDLGFVKSNRLLVEVVEAGPIDAFSGPKDAKKTRFLNALETLSNLIGLTAYLPTDEQCTTYKRKMKRRRLFLSQQPDAFKPNENNNNTITNNNDYDDEDECDFGK